MGSQAPSWALRCAHRVRYLTDQTQVMSGSEWLTNHDRQQDEDGRYGNNLNKNLVKRELAHCLPSLRQYLPNTCRHHDKADKKKDQGYRGFG